MDDRYDAIIIGAGIGGLVCGCYLAKAGMKVLIVEKNDKVGGCCTSFKRGNFTFEIGALENCRENGQFGKIIRDLEIDRKIKINRINPSHIVVTPECKISFKNNISETIKDIQEKFPHQAEGIEKFFEFIISSSFFFLYFRLKDKTFAHVLDEYFTDPKLKALLSFVVGQTGLPPARLSALTAAIHYREFIIDGGYYPEGGMQALANAIAERFQEFGGKLIFSNLVKKIKVNKIEVKGVVLQGGEYIEAKYVVSNCDATQTFLKLIGEKHLKTKFVEKIKKLLPSISVFIVYLGLGHSLKEKIDYCHELWYSPTYDIDDPWDVTRLQRKRLNGYIFCYFPSFCDPALVPQNNESITLAFLAPYRTADFWNRNKLELSDKIIARMEEAIPKLSSYIVQKEIATPQTLHKYTLNRGGAMRGWLPIPSQIDKSTMPQETPIKGLFLAGQWVTFPSGESGLPMAGYAGLTTAKLILKKKKDVK